MFQNMSAELMELLDLAEKIAAEMNSSFMGSEHILLAILKSDRTPLKAQLESYQMTYEVVKEDLMRLFNDAPGTTDTIVFTKTVQTLLELTLVHSYQKGRERAEVEDLFTCLLAMEDCVAYEMLARYNVDAIQVMKGMQQQSTMNELLKIKELTSLNAKMENTQQVILGRDKEIEKLIMILCRKEKSNPLLIGEPGIGKTAIVEEVARRITTRDVPLSLQNAIIFELNINNLVAGTKYRGEFEEKIERICGLVKKYPSAVLFIDEMHQIIGAGKAEGSIDAATVFKPYLARSELKVIGATTLEEYSKYIEKDRALERRFQTIVIKEPTAKETVNMIQQKIRHLMSYHNVLMEAGTVEEAVRYSEQFLPMRHFPDKAIDVLDMACVKSKMKQKYVVSKEEITQVIEDLANVLLDKDTRHSQLQSYLAQHMIGHEDIVQQIKVSLKHGSYKMNANRPLAVWCFAGEKGSGKSELAKHIGSGYFGDANQLIHLNMELYKEVNSLYYMTSQRDSIHHQPWNTLRKNPQCVLLLEHFNLAHMEVQLFFAKAFEEGGWKDQQGLWIDLRNTLIILTVNQAVQISIGFQKQEKAEAHPYLPLLEGQIDETFIFLPLRKQDYVNIAKRMFEQWGVVSTDEKIMCFYDTCQPIAGIRDWIKKLKMFLTQEEQSNMA